VKARHWARTTRVEWGVGKRGKPVRMDDRGSQCWTGDDIDGPNGRILLYGTVWRRGWEGRKYALTNAALHPSPHWHGRSHLISISRRHHSWKALSDVTLHTRRWAVTDGRVRLHRTARAVSSRSAIDALHAMPLVLVSLLHLHQLLVFVSCILHQRRMAQRLSRTHRPRPNREGCHALLEGVPSIEVKQGMTI
jgi:hypothetical protein